MKRGGEWRGMIWKVMEWREEREIDMDRIVDEKKGDEKGRGEMGREVKKKGERVVVVEKEKGKREMRDVWGMEMGGMDLEGFGLWMKERGVGEVGEG